MNRSFSKIRHIQEANARLDRRVIKEQDNFSGVEPTEEPSIEPTEDGTSIPDCSTKRSNTPFQVGDVKLVLPQGKVEVVWSGSGSPENRGHKIMIDGKPFCFIPRV